MSIILNNPNKSFYLSETSNNHQLHIKSDIIRQQASHYYPANYL